MRFVGSNPGHLHSVAWMDVACCVLPQVEVFREVLRWLVPGGVFLVNFVGALSVLSATRLSRLPHQ